MSYILVSPILTSPHCTLLLCYLLLWWSAAALLRQAVACATAVAPYGGTALAAKSGISTIRSSATYPQGGLLAADRALLKHLLENTEGVKVELDTASSYAAEASSPTAEPDANEPDVFTTQEWCSVGSPGALVSSGKSTV